jgi:hypothetical protein
VEVKRAPNARMEKNVMSLWTAVLYNAVRKSVNVSVVASESFNPCQRVLPKIETDKRLRYERFKTTL